MLPGNLTQRAQGAAPCDKLETIATPPEFLWPDTITMSHDGDLLFSAAQFHLMERARKSGAGGWCLG